MNMNDDQRKLAEDNMTLVYYIVNKYYPQHTRDDDVIQAGMFGLCKAAMVYDESKGAFSTIAGNYIVNYIKHHFRKVTPKAEVLSLDYEYDNSITLADVVKGDCDVASTLAFRQFVENEDERTRLVMGLYLQGYGSEEIAEMTGIKRRTVVKVKRLAQLKWEGMCNER